MKKILVTGATGGLGGEVLKLLVEKSGTKGVSAIARDISKLASYKEQGVNVLQADYDDKESLVKAFQGIETLYFVSGSDIQKRAKQHENVVAAAKIAGVNHVVYTSFQRKDETASSPIAPVASAHLRTEKLLKESGMAYTIMKHTLYAEVLPMFLGDNVFESGVIYQPAGEGKVAFASRDDMAEAGVNVLLTGGHDNKTYEISSAKTYSYSDVADILSEIGGKKISYVSPSSEEFTKTLSEAGVPAEIIGMSVMFNEGIKQGEFDFPDTKLETLIGKKPEDLSSFLGRVYSK